MVDKRNEKRLVQIGTLVSFLVGAIIGIVAGNTLLAIATGIILAILVQRFTRASEKVEDTSNKDKTS